MYYNEIFPQTKLLATLLMVGLMVSTVSADTFEIGCDNSAKPDAGRTNSILSKDRNATIDASRPL